jgi:hypothetical protein
MGTKNIEQFVDVSALTANANDEAGSRSGASS